MIDPGDAERHDKVAGRIKTLPDIAAAVQDDNEQEDDVKAFRHHWDNLHVLSTLMGNRNGRRPSSP